MHNSKNHYTEDLDRITDEIWSFTDHYHKQNGVFQCIKISNACETRKEECFLTI